MKLSGLALMFAITTPLAGSQVTFEFLPGRPAAIDLDGNRLAGYFDIGSGVEMAVWDEDAGVIPIPFPTPTGFFYEPTGISASGEVVVGNFREPSRFAAFRWTPEGGTVEIDPLPGAVPAVQVFAVSADGRVAVGGVTSGTGSTIPFRPFRWTVAGGYDLIQVPQVGVRSIRARAVDANGTRVAGDVNQIPMGVDCFVFEDGMTPVSWRDTSGSAFQEVDAFSADGSTAVGNATDTVNDDARPVFWTTSGGVQNIPFPAGTPTGSTARFLSVSGDGGLVVGGYFIQGTGPSTFLWQRGAPTSQDLKTFLIAQGITGLDNFQFRTPALVSIDGRVIAGNLVDLTNGTFSGYRVVLEPPSNAPLSSVFCTPQPLNSVGAVAGLEARGSIEARLNALELLATDLPVRTFGYFLASPNQAMGTTLPGSMGELCLGGPLRGLVMTVMQSDAAGTASDFIDQDTLPGSTIVMTGSTMNFQGWYRDVGPTSRFTAGAQVTFL